MATAARLTVLALTVGCLAACTNSSLTAGPTPNISGSWSGTIAGVQQGPGTIAFTLSQRGLPLLPPGVGAEQELTGTWSTTFAFAGYDRSGTVAGTVSQSSVTVTLTPGTPDCSYAVSATLKDSTSMSGTWTYAAANCANVSSGTVSAVRH